MHTDITKGFAALFNNNDLPFSLLASQELLAHVSGLQCHCCVNARRTGMAVCELVIS